MPSSPAAIAANLKRETEAARAAAMANLVPPSVELMANGEPSATGGLTLWVTQEMDPLNASGEIRLSSTQRREDARNDREAWRRHTEAATQRSAEADEVASLPDVVVAAAPVWSAAPWSWDGRGATAPVTKGSAKPSFDKEIADDPFNFGRPLGGSSGVRTPFEHLKL